MAELINDVGLGARILEPSAGMGSLLKAVNKAIQYSIAPIDFCEVQDEFIPSLEGLGARRVAGDFLEYTPGPIYNAVIMNPPYANKAAERHVDHAWNCISPGGKIVALVGKMTGEVIEEEFHGHVFEREEIPRNTFKETNIATILFLIHKPLYL